MKKVALLSLSLMLGIAGFAQRPRPTRNASAFKQSVTTQVKAAVTGDEEAPMSFTPTNYIPRVATSNRFGEDYTWEEFYTMTTYYDLQSNSAIANRLTVWEDGTAAIVETWDHNNATWAKRGTGYNHYNGSEFDEEPSERIEDMKSGWPSITKCGASEILVSHATGTNIYKRDVAGQGAWRLVKNLPEITWPRVITSGANGQYVHIIGADQDEQNTLLNYVYYYRSTDYGETWSDAVVPVDQNYYNYCIGADDYIMAANGDNVAIMFGAITTDIFYLISHDNGENWETVTICQMPNANMDGSGKMFDWSWNTMYNTDSDSTWWEDNSHSIAIANDGTVHVAFGMMRWAPSATTAGSYSYWPMTFDIVYWNSNYQNPVDGTNRIPKFGEWEKDNDPEWFGNVYYNQNGRNGVSSTLNEDRVYYLAEEDGHENLHIFGTYWYSPAPGDTVSYGEYWDNKPGPYRSLGIYTMPAIVLADNGDVYVGYNGLSKQRLGPGSAGQFYLYDAAVTYKKDGVWYDEEINFTGSFEHELDETYYMMSYPNEVNGYGYWSYNADDYIDLYLDYDAEAAEGQANVTDNYLVVVKYCLSGEDVAEVDPLNEVSSIYPNPANASAGINVNSAMNTDAVISFHNIAGQLVKTVSQNLTVGVNTINISDLTSGVYFCTVKANGYSKTVKLVVK